MNASQFRDWLAFHCARFTDVSAWLGKLPVDAANELDVTQGSILDAWRKILFDVDLDDAKKASQMLAAGDAEFSAKAGFSCHPRDVRKLCKSFSGERSREKRTRRYTRIEGQETYTCQHCRDEGHRFIVHPLSMHAARNGTLRHPTHNPEGRQTLTSAIAACPCDAGARWREVAGITFDDEHYLEWDGGSDQWDAVQAFANGGGNLPF